MTSLGEIPHDNSSTTDEMGMVMCFVLSACCGSEGGNEFRWSMEIYEGSQMSLPTLLIPQKFGNNSLSSRSVMF